MKKYIYHITVYISYTRVLMRTFKLLFAFYIINNFGVININFEGEAFPIFFVLNGFLNTFYINASLKFLYISRTLILNFIFNS